MTVLGLGAAALAGVAGSAHCVVMCGGIAAAVGGRSSRASPARLMTSTLTFNAGRLLGYLLVGGFLEVALRGALGLLPTGAVALGLRLVTAAVLAALALRLLDSRDLLGMERVGARFWRLLAPLTGRVLALPRRLRPLGLGLLWGFMPCGLVYSVLLLAAASGSLAGALATMAGFWAGTLPALVVIGSGTGFGLGRLRPGRSLTRAAGVVVLASALLTAYGALDPGAHHAHHVHGRPTAGPASDAGARRIPYAGYSPLTVSAPTQILTHPPGTDDALIACGSATT